MRLRIFLVESDSALRESLRIFLEELGHDVICTETGGDCPHVHAKAQRCDKDKPCADAAILGQYLPKLRGIDLIERRLHGGCKGLIANVALLCLPWSDNDRQRIEALGGRYFETPMQLTEVAGWLELVVRRSDPRRQLAPRAATA